MSVWRRGGDGGVQTLFEAGEGFSVRLHHKTRFGARLTPDPIGFGLRRSPTGVGHFRVAHAFMGLGTAPMLEESRLDFQECGDTCVERLALALKRTLQIPAQGFLIFHRVFLSLESLRIKRTTKPLQGKSDDPILAKEFDSIRRFPAQAGQNGVLPYKSG